MCFIISHIVYSVVTLDNFSILILFIFVYVYSISHIVYSVVTLDNFSILIFIDFCLRSLILKFRVYFECWDSSLSHPTFGEKQR